MGILAYGDIYKLCEELQQLVGTSLQNAASLSLNRHGLEFRMIGITKILVIDLTPNQPFLLSTDSTKMKIKNKPTPVSNFLRAHFVGLRLEKIEVAQKPNRTVRLEFTQAKFLTFKCFPHGQELALMANGKTIITPRRTLNKEKQDEIVTYVEPELVRSWEYNESMGLTRFENQMTKPKLAEPKIPKLEKALENFDKSLKEKESESQVLIAELQAKAHAMGLQKKVNGLELNAIYDKIKKIKAGVLASRQKRNSLIAKIENFKIHGEPNREVEPQRKKVFSGTRTQLDPQWELMIGRNANQNDELLKKAHPDDLWIHLRDYPGAHGILKGPKKKNPTPNILERACRIVAQLSQSKKSPFAQGQPLDFIITPRKFVKKPKGAAPGRVNIERETVRRIVFKITDFVVS